MYFFCLSKDEYSQIKRQFDPLIKSSKKKEESLAKYQKAKIQGVVVNLLCIHNSNYILWPHR